jgi:hypothetical protein
MKSEYEFFNPLDSADHNWRACEGDVTGEIEEMILSVDIQTGDYTRLLRFLPDADTSRNGTLTHEVWEEVWIISGTIEDLRLGESFGAGQYACRPPGMEHGPWKAGPDGAMTFEIRYTRRLDADG